MVQQCCTIGSGIFPSSAVHSGAAGRADGGRGASKTGRMDVTEGACGRRGAADPA